MGTKVSAKSLRWWEEPDSNIHELVSGVFEGGGAKGVLYAGALEALVEKGRWFDAVAGASAGAITAAMIAAGLSPKDISAAMDDALVTLQPPGVLRGILRLRAGCSYLNQAALIQWLQKLFEANVGCGNITFRQLHDLTQMELNVVAVDLRRGRHVVFNHVLTPKCQVAHAVAASAAIPFVFEWMPLQVPDKRLGVLVDGGVAANFPTFVFADPSFRAWAKLDPQTSQVVGFLLDEQQTDLLASEYEDAHLLEPLSQSPRAGFGPPKFKPKSEGGSLWNGVRVLLVPLRILTWPFTALFFLGIPKLLEWNAGNAGISTWDELEGTASYPTVRWFDRVLRGTQPWGFLLATMIVLTLQSGVGIYYLGTRPLYRVLTGDSVGSISGQIVAVIVYIAAIAIGIYAWTVLVAMFAGTSILHSSGRAIGYGLLKTFLWGSGAPPWAGAARDDHVVKLAVPKDVTTLGLGKNIDRSEILREARQSAAEQLERVFRTPADEIS